MLKRWLVILGKLLLCGLAFSVGMIVGGLVASLLRLQPPSMPQGVDSSTAVVYLFLESPILALALALVARGLSGGFITRTLILSFFTWIAYTLNTVIEAAVFTTTSAPSSSLFTLVSFLVPSLFCAAAVAFLFHTGEDHRSLAAICTTFFNRRSAGAWVWRLAAASVAFIPIYILFGSLVYPITGEYYRQEMLGLRAAEWDQILPVLFVRSILFVLACLPIIVTWRGTRRSLFLSLGFALFVLVGLLYMLAAYWMPPMVRVPHSLEIMADSFVYAGVLVALLAGGDTSAGQEQRDTVINCAGFRWSL